MSAFGPGEFSGAAALPHIEPTAVANSAAAISNNERVIPFSLAIVSAAPQKSRQPSQSREEVRTILLLA
jgi:hypothetical protein